MEEAQTRNKINLWIITTVILALALVGMFIFYNGQKNLTGPAGEKLTVLSSAEASEKLVGFLNEAYGDRISVTANSVKEEYGLYKVSVSINDKTQGSQENGDLYISQDGRLFIPQPLVIEEILSQVRAAQTLPPAAPVDGTNQSPTPSDTSTPTPTDTETPSAP